MSTPPKILNNSHTEVIKGTQNPKHGFSRKLENHEAAVALNYFVYNSIRIHRTLRTSPAMAAGSLAGSGKWWI